MQRNAEHIYDELLVLRAQDGEVEAMNELVSRWNHRLLAHARHLLSDESAASDALQDAWYDIVRTIGKLHDPAAYRVWMYRIVSRRCTDGIRRKVRHRRLLAGTPVPAEASSTDEQVQHSDEGRALRKALATLPGDIRAMLALRYRENLPLAAIALVLNCPATTVKSRLHEARRQLRSLLEPDQGKE